MKVLIVGAGAVGVVYGRHLQLAGAELSFYVRDKYRPACEQGLTVYPLNKDRSFKPVDFKEFSVLSSPEEVAAQSFDQVWLAVPILISCKMANEPPGRNRRSRGFSNALSGAAP